MLFYCLFQYFEEKEYQTKSKRNEINWRSYFWKETHLMDLDPTLEDTGGAHEGGGRAHPPRARPPASWGPRSSTDVIRPPIYICAPPNYQIRSQNPNSTAVTFYIREIPSWSLHRRSAGGGIDNRGLLHQHHSSSDEL